MVKAGASIEPRRPERPVVTGHRVQQRQQRGLVDPPAARGGVDHAHAGQHVADQPALVGDADRHPRPERLGAAGVVQRRAASSSSPFSRGWSWPASRQSGRTARCARAGCRRRRGAFAAGAAAEAGREAAVSRNVHTSSRRPSWWISSGQELGHAVERLGVAAGSGHELERIALPRAAADLAARSGGGRRSWTRPARGRFPLGEPRPRSRARRSTTPRDAAACDRPAQREEGVAVRGPPAPLGWTARWRRAPADLEIGADRDRVRPSGSVY